MLTYLIKILSLDVKETLFMKEEINVRNVMGKGLIHYIMVVPNVKVKA
jgi:hypothetical protein